MEMASETIDKQVTSKVKNICIRFEGNNSKRWDGKEILLETSVLEDMYEPGPANARQSRDYPLEG